jgi:hypothetical protein
MLPITEWCQQLLWPEEELSTESSIRAALKGSNRGEHQRAASEGSIGSIRGQYWQHQRAALAASEGKGQG